MEDIEVWKHLANYENYEVSSFGKVRNKKTSRILKPSCHGGYMSVGLSNVGKTKSHSVHRLVALTFLDNKPQVNHKDKNRSNNNVHNLEWCSALGNNQHNHNTGLIKTFTRRIRQYNLDGELIKEYDSIINAKKDLGITSIKKVLYNKQKTAGGFIWKYLD